MLETGQQNREKLERLYREYSQLMAQVAFGVLRDWGLAEDCVHQAFVRVIHHLDKIEEENCPKTKAFLVIIVKRIAIDLYRQGKQRQILSFESFEEGEAWLAPHRDPEDPGFLAEAMAALPEQYSSVLYLKYSHGYSDREISEMLGLGEENVRKRLQRGKKKLEQLLKEGGDAVGEKAANHR